MPWFGSCLAAARVPDAQLVGRRTSAAALTAVYGIPLPFSGPRFASSTPGGGSAGALSATVSFVGLGPGNDGPLVVVEPNPVGPLANSSVCPVGVGAVLCQGFMIQVRGLRACVDCRVRSPAPLPLASSLQGSDGVWYNASAVVAVSPPSSIVLSAPEAPKGLSAVATASGWSLWPITLLYSAGGLPAFPWNETVG